MKWLTIFGGSLVCVLLTGCGTDLPDTVPVSGTVTLDGDPVEGATVNMLSDESSIVAHGKTDANGEFTVSTIIGSRTVEGAVVGTHKIAVVKTDSQGQQMEDPKKMMEEMTTNPAITSEFRQTHLIPEKYKNPSMSQLTAEVTASGPNEITLELSSN